MKRISIPVFIMATVLLFCSGCALFGREPDARDITKEYIPVFESYDSPGQYIGEISSGAVVTVVSNYYIHGYYSSGASARITEYFSGIVLNSGGYILTTSSASCIYDESGNSIDSSSVYAVLSPVYQDEEEYVLRKVAVDDDCGLALYKFYDRFYFTDESGEIQNGLQFTAQFSGNVTDDGSRCWAVGNSLGNLFPESAVEQTITQGIVSSSELDKMNAAETNHLKVSFNGKQYYCLLSTAPTTPEMAGGALFDQNGYIVGVIIGKLVSDTDGGTDYLDRATLCLKPDIVTDFVNYVSESLQTVIPITIASSSEGVV